MTSIIFLLITITFIIFSLSPLLTIPMSITKIKAIYGTEKILTIKTPIKKRTFLFLLYAPFLILYSILSHHGIGYIICLSLCCMTLTLPFTQLFEARHAGFYTKGFLYPQFSDEWTTIEGFIDSPNSIRFIHKERGVIDILCSPTEAETAKQYLIDIQLPQLHEGMATPNNRKKLEKGY